MSQHEVIINNERINLHVNEFVSFQLVNEIADCIVSGWLIIFYLQYLHNAEVVLFYYFNVQSWY